MKRIVRLTENELHSVIRESVNKIIKESQYSDEPLILNGDYTDKEKKKIEKKRKDSEKRKQNAEKNEQNKKAKEKEDSDKLINQQRELYNYKDLFGN